MKIWLYQVLRPFIKLFVVIFIRPRYIGLDNIPIKNNFILSGNHTSYLDCLLLISSTKKTIHFLAKDSLLKGSSFQEWVLFLLIEKSMIKKL